MKRWTRDGAGSARLEDLQAAGRYVVGPGTSTANAVARYSDATGLLIKDSNFTVDDTGNASIAGTLNVAGDFSVATNKFTVAAASGNTVIAGTLRSMSTVSVGGSNTGSDLTVTQSSNTASGGLRLISSGGQVVVMFVDNSPVVTFALSNGNSATLSAGGIWTNSAADLKSNVTDLPPAAGLEALRQLRTVSYDWTIDGWGADANVGLLAEEVARVVPAAVRDAILELRNDQVPASLIASGVTLSDATAVTGTFGNASFETTPSTMVPIKQVNYALLVVPLIAAVKELDARLAALEQRFTTTPAA